MSTLTDHGGIGVSLPQKRGTAGLVSYTWVARSRSGSSSFTASSLNKPSSSFSFSFSSSRCLGMRFLEQIHTLVVLGDGGVCRGSAGSRGVGGEEGSRLKTCTFVRARLGIDLCPDALVKAIW